MKRSAIHPVDACPKAEVFFEMLQVPVYCNLLWSEQQAARNCPKGDIKLAFDSDTGLITNVSFDPAKLEYDQDYENSLHYSPQFQQYAHSLAADLIERHNLFNKTIIEIGCGKGDFLISLCQLGHNRGVGFDPSYVPRREHRFRENQVQFIQDFYSEDYQDYQADLICCRHTLEHIINPAALLQPLRRAIGDRLDTVVFFEVPNALHTFRQLAVWDLIYEHCCYFVPASLMQAFTACGFAVQEVRETFDGQFLCLEALPIASDRASANARVEEIQPLSRELANFTSQFQAKVEAWNHRLSEITANQRAVVWGAGSKGVTFLNLFKNQPLEYVVDLNPRKQGRYVAGSGQQIVSPEFLPDYSPDLVIVMNPIYENEIRQILTGLGLTPQFICA